MGGISAEREVSLVTGKAVHTALTNKGLNSVAIDVDHNIARTLDQNRIDLAFLALHGTYGEDGTIQGLLEYMKIPYTGSGVLGSALAYNKLKSKEVFMQHGIPTADYEVVDKTNRHTFKRTLNLPVVIKPSDQGSSVGTSIVTEESQWPIALDLAFRYSNEILVEEYIDGKLLAIGMLGETPLPIVDIRPKSGFYDYESKYTPGKTEYTCPAELSAEETRLCGETSIRVFKALKGRGVPRVDIILSRQGIPYVLEMNTIPGMTPTSLLPRAAQQAGMDFDNLVIDILNRAQLDYES